MKSICKKAMQTLFKFRIIEVKSINERHTLYMGLVITLSYVFKRFKDRTVKP